MSPARFSLSVAFAVSCGVLLGACVGVQSKQSLEDRVAFLVSQELGKTQAAAPPGSRVVATRAQTFSHSLDLDGDGTPDCSSTAVSPQALLTATHCLPPGVGPLLVSGVRLVAVGRVDDGADHTLLLFSGPVFGAFSPVSLEPLSHGDQIYGLGNPGGAQAPVFRAGLVSGQRQYQDWAATLYDLNAHPGDSGAGVLDAFGVLRGVVSFVDVAVHQGSYLKLTGSLPLGFTEEQWASAGVVFNLNGP